MGQWTKLPSDADRAGHVVRDDQSRAQDRPPDTERSARVGTRPMGAGHDIKLMEKTHDLHIRGPHVWNQGPSLGRRRHDSRQKMAAQYTRKNPELGIRAPVPKNDRKLKEFHGNQKMQQQAKNPQGEQGGKGPSLCLAWAARVLQIHMVSH